ncbi:hypothetical protein SELR_pSRC200770 (plasmid) [Selenomonas ruminantium subsp. lactilytica TAM6421]|uniref:Uncharacterized protein n=1 Tax=Selenomonas ruminantium subsp. lactilytica (strain NBRC 103574 / TAM6421) TaxID=927704 RepID=I0GV24_SELRL|nr:hypothetical protein SELR_pSRC200770 [Selenomonas ruminantium subsp. lactilytica TAM6421]
MLHEKNVDNTLVSLQIFFAILDSKKPHYMGIAGLGEAPSRLDDSYFRTLALLIQ